MIQVIRVKSVAIKEVFSFFFTSLFILVFSYQLQAQSGWKKNAAGHDVYIYKPAPPKPYIPTPREKTEYTPKVPAVEPAKAKPPVIIEEKKVTIDSLFRIEKKYYESGELMVYRPFVNGQQNGIEEQYHKNGKISSVIFFKDGKEDGIVKHYYPNGQLSIEIPYINGTIHGISKWYYASGKLAWTLQRTNGKLTGIVKKYYESGKLQSEKPYIDDKANGFFKEYYENGKLEKQTLFKDNEVVKTELPKAINKPPPSKVIDPPKKKKQ